jgi:hypothetical protein
MAREQKTGHVFFDHRKSQIETAYTSLYSHLYAASRCGNAGQQKLFRSHRKTLRTLVGDLLTWNENEGKGNV